MCCTDCPDSWVHLYDPQEGVTLVSRAARELGIARRDSARMSATITSAWDGVDGQHIVVGFPDARSFRPRAWLDALEAWLRGEFGLPLVQRLGKAVVLRADGTVLDELVGIESGADFGTALAQVGDMLAGGAPLWYIAGDAPWQHFGWSTAFGSDLDHDGILEVAVGGPGAWAGQSTDGRVHIRNVGGAAVGSALTTAGSTDELRGPGKFLFGYSVAAVGDVNGDGFEDLGISMAYDPDGTPGHRGRWLVLTGIGPTKPDAIGEFRWDTAGAIPVPWR